MGASAPVPPQALQPGPTCPFGAPQPWCFPSPALTALLDSLQPLHRLQLPAGGARGSLLLPQAAAANETWQLLENRAVEWKSFDMAIHTVPYPCDSATNKSNSLGGWDAQSIPETISNQLMDFLQHRESPGAGAGQA